jgi:two-component system, OmpR family, phosphate regulon sensor histidine kinase PhoR
LQEPWQKAVLSRVAAARWPLLVGAVAILYFAASGGASLLLALAAIAVMVAAAAATPPAARDGRQADAEPTTADALASISALDMVDAVSDPLLIFDRAGAVVHANAALASVFGAIQAGTSLALRFRAPEMQALIAGVLRSGRANQIDYSERTPIERWYRVVAAPVGQDGGLFVLMFRDQSETRRIDRMRADFIANASHELRTPLASIAGFIETLRGAARNDAAAREQFLQIMQNQTGRMARLIDDLLSLSRLEMKPFVNPSERVDLRHLLESVIGSLSQLARESGVTVERSYPDGALAIPGSQDELTQVFENLVENALKYGQSGGRVELTVERPSSDEVTVTVRDFGPGIPEEHIPRITERFYRVDVAESRAQKGTGLGLAIVKHILTRHRGRLAIRSEVGKGAAFTVHLPARQDHSGS